MNNRPSFLQSLYRFIGWCKAGKRALYWGPDWVGMDVESYRDLRRRAEANIKRFNLEGITYSEEAVFDEKDYNFLMERVKPYMILDEIVDKSK